MHALDDARVRIELRQPPAEGRRVAVAFGDENGAGAGEVRGGLAQRAARQHMLVAERLLVINQHHVHAPAAQFPVLKPVVQQQRVAAEFFNRVTAAFHAVFVHQNDDVLEVGREHVRFVPGGFGIQEQRFSVGDHPRRGAVPAEEKSVDDPFGQRRRLGAVAARENGHGPALVAEFARELFHHRRLAGAADGEIADGDDLHAQRGVAQNADIVQKTARLDGDLKDLGQREERGAKEGGALAATLFKNDFQNEGFNGFSPGTESFAHVVAVCQPAPREASGHGISRGNTPKVA